MNETLSNTKLWLALPTAILVGILNVFLFFLFMVLYGHVIDPATVKVTTKKRREDSALSRA